MVKIIEIRPVRSKACIVLNTGESFWLHQEDLQNTCFTENAELENETFFHWIRILQYPRALNLAVSMLARRPCSKGEIQQKLLHHRYTPEVAELVLYKLEKERLVNDADFCDQWIRYRLCHNYGISVICRELRLKGIPEELIHEALEKVDPDETSDHAFSLAVKQWKKTGIGDDIYKTRQKIISCLVRKGYCWSEARDACLKAEQEIKKEKRCTDL